MSRNWREIIVQDKKANRRRKFYISQLKTDSEVMYIILSSNGFIKIIIKKNFKNKIKMIKIII